MSALEFNAFGVQLVLPLAILAWFAFTPAKSLMSYGVRFFATGLALLALYLVPIWLIPPWWAPIVYFAFWLVAFASHVLRDRIPSSPAIPQHWRSWISSVALALFGIWCTSIITSAIVGRLVPSGPVVDLAFPMGPGTYLVANGGSNAAVNGHLLTLNPKTPRQRAYRGQSYGIDLIKLGRLGLRAPGWRPQNPARYEIFGEPVYAPCAGKVLTASDGMPDMPVPEPDTSRLEGNHVLIDCQGIGIVLAHFKKDSLRVETGDVTTLGQKIAEAGNSGQSFEPHLHVHAQQLASNGPPLSGEPIFLSFDGRLPVRNDRFTISEP